MNYYLTKTHSQKIEIHLANGITDIAINKTADLGALSEFLEHIFNTQNKFSFSLSKNWFLKINRGLYEKK